MKTSGQKGFAMVLVLWVVALLMVIIPVFVHSMRSESTALLNTADSTTAHALALAGVEAAINELTADFSIVSKGDEGLVLLERAAGGLKPLPSEREFTLGNGLVSYTIEDERGRININTAGRDVLDSLLRLTGVQAPERDIITDSILDWRDENHEFHLNGAEDDYYASLPHPYGAKDGPADFKEELLLVKGMTEAVFYGKETGAAETQRGGIRPHITIYGDNRLNLNTASTEALEAYYGKGIASEIILKRQSEGAITIPVNNGLVTSDTFTIESTGEYNGMRYTVEAIVIKKPGAGGIANLSWRDRGVAP